MILFYSRYSLLTALLLLLSSPCSAVSYQWVRNVGETGSIPFSSGQNALEFSVGDENGAITYFHATGTNGYRFSEDREVLTLAIDEVSGASTLTSEGVLSYYLQGAGADGDQLFFADYSLTYSFTIRNIEQFDLSDPNNPEMRVSGEARNAQLGHSEIVSLVGEAVIHLDDPVLGNGSITTGFGQQLEDNSYFLVERGEFLFGLKIYNSDLELTDNLLERGLTVLSHHGVIDLQGRPLSGGSGAAVIAAKNTEVPEPASVLLLGAAIFGGRSLKSRSRISAT